MVVRESYLQGARHLLGKSYPQAKRSPPRHVCGSRKRMEIQQKANWEMLQIQSAVGLGKLVGALLSPQRLVTERQFCQP